MLGVSAAAIVLRGFGGDEPPPDGALTTAGVVLGLGHIVLRRLGESSRIAPAATRWLLVAAMALAAALGPLGVWIAWSIDGDVPDSVVGDPHRLRQVLVNLVGNAIKFTEKGSVELQVAVNTRTTESVCLHFQVKDTGVGISASKKQQIFAPFSQADASTTRNFAILSQVVRYLAKSLLIPSFQFLASVLPSRFQ